MIIQETFFSSADKKQESITENREAQSIEEVIPSSSISGTTPRKQVIALFIQLKELFNKHDFYRQSNETLTEFLAKAESKVGAEKVFII